MTLTPGLDDEGHVGKFDGSSAPDFNGFLDF
jgi:hypothetical protein